MSRLAALKNLVAGPLANAKAVSLPCLSFSNASANRSRQYAKNIYETEPAIAWSFTIGLAGVIPPFHLPVIHHPRRRTSVGGY
jgi:hypothetical protein